MTIEQLINQIDYLLENPLKVDNLEFIKREKSMTEPNNQRCFIDSNIWLYAFSTDQKDNDKR